MIKILIMFKLLLIVLFFYLLYRRFSIGYLTQFEYFLMVFFFFFFSIAFIMQYIKTKRDKRTTHLDK
jgi:hypothetical protein